MTETERMLSGKLYDPGDPALAALRREAHILCQRYNLLAEDEEAARADILRQLLPEHGENLYLQGPIQFDYGRFTTFGANCYANFNLTVLDCCPVVIGDNVFFGTNVSLLTPIHPLRWQERNLFLHPERGELTDREYAAPITIGSSVWIAGSVTVTGGVTIGSGSVIGAGSVVTRDVPENVLAFGSPCRVIRPITEADRLSLRPELF